MKRRKRLIVGAALALGLVVAGAAVFALFGLQRVVAQADGGLDAAGGAGGAGTPGLMYSTKERVLNLADPGGFRYLKTEVVVELGLPQREMEGLKGDAYKKKQDDVAKELAPLAPIINDVINSLISSKKSADLLTTDGKTGLRAELKERLDPVIRDYPVKGIYLAQFIIQ